MALTLPSMLHAPFLLSILLALLTAPRVRSNSLTGLSEHELALVRSVLSDTVSSVQEAVFRPVSKHNPSPGKPLRLKHFHPHGDHSGKHDAITLDPSLKKGIKEAIATWKARAHSNATTQATSLNATTGAARHKRHKGRHGLLTPAHDAAKRAPPPSQPPSAPAPSPRNVSDGDYAAFVNTFIGTDNYGDVFPGSAVPFSMAKFGLDMTGYAPAGYILDPASQVWGVSPLHDSGTGASTGSYGNFPVFPQVCPGGNFDLCAVTLEDRLLYRKNNTDFASPGYFTSTLENGIKMEMSSTRRAGLERFTFPESLLKETGSKPFLILDITNDLPSSWKGGNMTFDRNAGRLKASGRFVPSFGSGLERYEAHVCMDLLNNGKQTLHETGVWAGDNFGMDQKLKNENSFNLTENYVGGQPVQAGILASFSNAPKASNGKDWEITIRVGVSFHSADKACQNMEEEVPNWDLDSLAWQSRALWNKKLRRIELSRDTDPEVLELFYSSFYRSFLTPNNATDEAPFPTDQPFFDSLYCSWDTFRSFYPLLSLTSAHDFADIVNNYVDGWRRLGAIPECRSNQLPGLTQGGSDGTNILADFAVKYWPFAKDLGVDLGQLYDALYSDATLEPPEWDFGGRQIRNWVDNHYVAFGYFDPAGTGRQTREGSRTLEYAFNDFAVRQVAFVLGKENDTQLFTNRSLWYRNVFDPSVTSDGFKGFAQKRLPNGTYYYENPKDCSPLDTNSTRSCSLQQATVTGFYEASSWEYTFFAPHDSAGLMELMGGKTEYVRRLHHFFDNGYYDPGNEPSFQTPVMFHYANNPTASVKQSRKVVYDNFGTTAGGLPGNDDQAAMATFLIFHLLGLYPVPSTTEYLILSPFTPEYTIHNAFFNASTTIRAENFDSRSLNSTFPIGTRAYVRSVTIDGKKQESRCKIDFVNLVGGNGSPDGGHHEIVLELTSDELEANSCGSSADDLPSSLSTGGFASSSWWKK